MTRDPREPDEAPGPAASNQPLTTSDPSDDSIEIVELTEVSELIVIVEQPGPPEPPAAPEVSELIVIVDPPGPPEPPEPPEVSELIVIVDPPGPFEPPEQPGPDQFTTLFDDPQQMQAELRALRAANHELVRINGRLADAVEQRTADMLASRDTQAQFIADVNRQVRGPLDAIIGYSELLTEDLTSLELHDLAHDVEKIRSAGESLLDLLGELIERRRLDGG